MGRSTSRACSCHAASSSYFATSRGRGDGCTRHSSPSSVISRSPYETLTHTLSRPKSNDFSSCIHLPPLELLQAGRLLPGPQAHRTIPAPIFLYQLMLLHVFLSYDSQEKFNHCVSCAAS